MNEKSTRRALIVGFIGMMTLTAASAATAGVAWFTTTRTATVKFPSAAVKSNRGSLLVGKFGQNGSSREYEIKRPNDDFTAEMDSVSSADGVGFYNALLDVDGSELVDGSGNGRYFKVDGNYAQFAFAASTQRDANTDFNVYLERMDITVAGKGYENVFQGDGTTAEFVLEATPDSAPAVYVGEDLKQAGQEEDYVYDSAAKKITFNEGKIPADGEEITVTYLGPSHDMPESDPIYKSIRVALFAAPHNVGDTAEDVTKDENLSLVWDTTSADGEKHHGITVKDENKNVEGISESKAIRNASNNFIDLDFVPNEISSVTYTRGETAPVAVSENREADEENPAIENGYHLEGRRVYLDYGAAKGDLITVVYDADKPTKEEYGNVAGSIDGYYAGENLGETAVDGDLTAYGAFLGEVKSNVNQGLAIPLNVVTRVWIEGTDVDHKIEGEKWNPTTKDSIDISSLEYQVSMDLSLVAIDSNVA